MLEAARFKVCVLLLTTGKTADHLGKFARMNISYACEQGKTNGRRREETGNEGSAVGVSGSVGFIRADKDQVNNTGFSFRMALPTSPHSCALAGQAAPWAPDRSPDRWIGEGRVLQRASLCREGALGARPRLCRGRFQEAGKRLLWEDAALTGWQEVKPSAPNGRSVSRENENCQVPE